MSSEYKFVPTDSAEIVSQLISEYETQTGHTLQPSDPDRLFLSWIADVIISERVRQNYTGNQNIPSRAEGENLDALGEWIYSLKRREAQSARCTMRFVISEAQKSIISIPRGTRVSDLSQRLVWETVEDAVVQIGDTTADVTVECQTAGTAGNGYTEGQINVLIDVDNVLYYSSCSNITVSAGGSEEESDAAYLEMMRRSLDSYSTAGAEASYIYWAKSVSDQIGDVKAIRPSAAQRITVPTYTDDSGDRYAFVGGDYLYKDSLMVYAEGSEQAAVVGTDYTVDYTDNLMKIALTRNGSIATAHKVDVLVESELAGHVHIYALMQDGTPAGEEIKSAILAKCSDDYVRPMTDYVSVKDVEQVKYDIICTYYVSDDTGLSLTDIQTAVDEAVNTYVLWQRERIGRDINPSMLENLLMKTGVKRVVINSPTFTRLRSGSRNDVPQIATLNTVRVTNGGYEDE